MQQQKWCTLVSHLADDQLPSNKLPRRLTVFLEAPPGDGLRVAREHFLEYVKPVLVSAALDWEVVEGRREGEIRAGLAERIRRKRRKAGERGERPDDNTEIDARAALEANRKRTGVEEWDGLGGDVVIGRHAWKEYVRGTHEGWLGPMDEPKEPMHTDAEDNSKGTEAKIGDILRKKSDNDREESDVHATPDPDLLSTPAADPLPAKSSEENLDEASPISSEPPQENKAQEPEPLPKPLVPPAYNTTSSYPSSSLAPSTPPEFTPSTPVAFPNLLGFFNTPIRMYRFLTRRHLADDIGRQTAAAVLAAHRPFQQMEPSVSSSSFKPESVGASESSVTSNAQGSQWEQEEILKLEEFEWHKSVRKREPEKDKEREWTDAMVLDERIALRMRKFELDREDEDRAKRIAKGAKGIPGRREDRRSDYEW